MIMYRTAVNSIDSFKVIEAYIQDTSFDSVVNTSEAAQEGRRAGRQSGRYRRVGRQAERIHTDVLAIALAPLHFINDLAQPTPHATNKRRNQQNNLVHVGYHICVLLKTFTNSLEFF